jgi:hypothetical protein
MKQKIIFNLSWSLTLSLQLLLFVNVQLSDVLNSYDIQSVMPMMTTTTTTTT